MEKDAQGCFELLIRLHPIATALEEEEARLFYSKALTLCLECEPFVTGFASVLYGGEMEGQAQEGERLGTFH